MKIRHFRKINGVIHFPLINKDEILMKDVYGIHMKHKCEVDRKHRANIS